MKKRVNQFCRKVAGHAVSQCIQPTELITFYHARFCFSITLNGEVSHVTGRPGLHGVDSTFLSDFRFFHFCVFTFSFFFISFIRERGFWRTRVTSQPRVNSESRSPWSRCQNQVSVQQLELCAFFFLILWFFNFLFYLCTIRVRGRGRLSTDHKAARIF